MTVAGEEVLDAAQLHRHDTLGEGGQGLVHLVSTGTEPGQLLAYKEYRAVLLGQVDWSALRRLVAVRAKATDETRTWFDSHSAWPRQIVTEKGRPRGFLMSVAPAEYGVRLDHDAGITRLAVEFLLNPLEYLHHIGLRLSDVHRVDVLQALAALLAQLHALEIAVGDLSPKNVLVRLKPPVDCFLLDCDTVRTQGGSVLPQVETPDWQLPDGEETGTPAGDVYKLGLLAIRLFAGDQASRDATAVRQRLAVLSALVDQSLAPRPEDRPTAAAWVAQLSPARLNADPTVPVLAATPPAPGIPAASAATRLPVRGRRWWRWAVAAVAVALTLGLAVGLSGNDEPTLPATQPAPAGGAVQQPTFETPTQPAPLVEYGIVRFDDVAADPRAVDVARLLDTYFGGINDRDPDVALSAFDPDSTPDYSVVTARQRFAADVASSTDSDIRIVELRDGDGRPVAVIATVTFQSNQPAGKGPARDPSETCTRWTVTYSLSERTPGNYLLLRGKGSSTPC